MLFTCLASSHDVQFHNCANILRQVQSLQNKTLPYLVARDQYFSKEMHNHLLLHIPDIDINVSRKYNENKLTYLIKKYILY